MDFQKEQNKMPTRIHECPLCFEDCDCEKGSKIMLEEGDDYELDMSQCDHDCEDEDGNEDE